MNPPVFSIYWDLDVQTNAVIKEHPPTNHLPPHPEIELQRAQLVTKLRQHYHELCHQREGTVGHNMVQPNRSLVPGAGFNLDLTSLTLSLSQVSIRRGSRSTVGYWRGK